MYVYHAFHFVLFTHLLVISSNLFVVRCVRLVLRCLCSRFALWFMLRCVQIRNLLYFCFRDDASPRGAGNATNVTRVRPSRPTRQRTTSSLTLRRPLRCNVVCAITKTWSRRTLLTMCSYTMANVSSRAAQSSLVSSRICHRSNVCRTANSATYATPVRRSLRIIDTFHVPTRRLCPRRLPR